MIVWLASYPRSGNTLLRTIFKQTMDLGSYFDEPVPELPADLELTRAAKSEFGHLPVDGRWDAFYERASASAATGSLLPWGAGYESQGAPRKLRVPVVTLDGHLAQAPPGARVALIKIDTQGHDLAVIRGACGTLASDRPLVIAEVIDLPLCQGQCTPESIFEAMDAQSYETYTLFNIHASVEGRLAFADALFVPRELAVPYSQRFEQLDNHVSYRTQIETLDRICAERLEVINVLDVEVKRLAAAKRR